MFTRFRFELRNVWKRNLWETLLARGQNNGTGFDLWGGKRSCQDIHTFPIKFGLNGSTECLTHNAEIRIRLPAAHREQDTICLCKSNPEHLLKRSNFGLKLTLDGAETPGFRCRLHSSEPRSRKTLWQSKKRYKKICLFKSKYFWAQYSNYFCQNIGWNPGYE